MTAPCEVNAVTSPSKTDRSLCVVINVRNSASGFTGCRPRRSATTGVAFGGAFFADFSTTLVAFPVFVDFKVFLVSDFFTPADFFVAFTVDFDDFAGFSVLSTFDEGFARFATTFADFSLFTGVSVVPITGWAPCGKATESFFAGRAVLTPRTGKRGVKTQPT